MSRTTVDSGRRFSTSLATAALAVSESCCGGVSRSDCGMTVRNPTGISTASPSCRSPWWTATSR